MKAFHNKQEIKDKYINRLKEHAKKDEIIKGKYWADGKGCSVGCTVHSSDPRAYEVELGIPTILAKLEDRLFESLPNAEAKKFPLQFLNAIPVGADLSTIWPKFAIFLLTDKSQCNSRHEMCNVVANVYRDELEGKKVNWKEIMDKITATTSVFDDVARTSRSTAARTASYAANAASYAARSAARSAARAADAAAYTDRVVASAAEAAFDAAEAAFDASAYDSRVVASASYAAIDAFNTIYTSNYSKARAKQVNYLLKLLKEAK
jgi:hypothetical protein